MVFSLWQKQQTFWSQQSFLIFPRLCSEPFCCVIPPVNGGASCQAGNTEVTILHCCTREAQMQQHLSCFCCCFATWLWTENLYGLLLPLHRWEWWCFSHWRRVYATFGGGGWSVGWKWNTEIRAGCLAGLGRVSYYLFSIPNMKFFVFIPKQKKHKTFWIFPKISYWHNCCWSFVHFWTTALKLTPWVIVSWGSSALWGSKCSVDFWRPKQINFL